MTTVVETSKPSAKADPSSDVYRSESHPLDPLFAPRSVAVVGATERMGSVGRSVLWNLLSSPFGGTVFPVNSKRPNVLGIKAYPNVSELPDKVDLVVVTTPADTRSGCAGGVGGGRHSGGHRDFGGLQGARRARQRARDADHADHSRQDAADRAELPGRDESGAGPERDVRTHHRAAGQRGLHQPERRAC